MARWNWFTLLAILHPLKNVIGCRSRLPLGAIEIRAPCARSREIGE